MADRTIKPDSGNDLVLQNNGGGAKIEIPNSGDIAITGTIGSGTIGSGVSLPAGSVLQVVVAQDSKAFAYTNSSQWDWGTATTRGNDSHGGVADNLNCTLTTKGVNSNFLVCANLQNAGANAADYTWGLNTYWSVDSYADPLVVGDPSTHGIYTSGEGLQSGFWTASVTDKDLYPHYTQVLKSSNTIAKGTAITFKIVLSTYYSSGGNILYYNRQNTTVNGAYRLVPVSTQTVYEIAT